jgi:hypothetical protein
LWQGNQNKSQITGHKIAHQTSLASKVPMGMGKLRVRVRHMEPLEAAKTEVPTAPKRHLAIFERPPNMTNRGSETHLTPLVLFFCLSFFVIVL